jgi:hypothetical protein
MRQARSAEMRKHLQEGRKEPRHYRDTLLMSKRLEIRTLETNREQKEDVFCAISRGI